MGITFASNQLEVIESFAILDVLIDRNSSQAPMTSYFF